MNRLWSALTDAIQQKDMEKATTSKTAVEDAQRERRRRMEEHGEKHVPRFFELKNDHWVPKISYVLPSNGFSMILTHVFSLPDDPGAATEAVKDWLFPQRSQSLAS
jgi:hypothetical protein